MGIQGERRVGQFGPGISGEIPPSYPPLSRPENLLFPRLSDDEGGTLSEKIRVYPRSLS